MKKFLISASLIFLAGCGLFWDDPYVTVTTNPLNWVEIHYYNANRDPVRRVSVRITGSGFVESKSGTSRRVSDSFAKNINDETWEDYRTARYNVDQNHVKEIFQELVNAGLFDRDKMFTSTKEPSPGRFIAVRAAIDNKTITVPKNMFEEDPELAERLYNAILQFNKPHLGKRVIKKDKDKKDTAKDSKK
ncbi:MAG: hypothetical protein J6V88_05195 [Kiritimatiellae bacterium]|nr:hypothetical protein [Kiritimatiellia bacterium]